MIRLDCPAALCSIHFGIDLSPAPLHYTSLIQLSSRQSSYISIYPFDPLVSLRLSHSLYGLSWDFCIYELSPCDFLKQFFP